ncbi:kinetochore protein NUF2, putative [Plasmodium relictum]|uniref:Kinetochore protein NUF2, putative n=1 Tax=Plasmodium relictum TaxID=85471 RepID=A0A1J1H2G9_PLARL|nr:kinetochore protein NUF2, putative [Plasmodium relictum]CRG98759.1 kinetochore protein NUF2, putative [Plasmodium relictum]
MNVGNEIVPRYGFEEMKNEISKYGVEITQSTLKNPTTEDVQGVYSICIKYILNKDINNIRIEEFTGDLKSSMPSIDGIQILPNEGKNHLQAIGNLRFIRHCEKINKILNLDNTLSYIFKPVSSHITKLINAFIHFMKYKEEIYNENDAKIKKIQEKKNEDSILESELKTVDSELHILLGKHDEIKNSIINEKNTKRNYEEEIIENQNLLNAQQSVIISLKSTKDKIANETNELIFQFSRLRQKKEDLEDQIVPSPEKLQQYNEELKDLLSEHMSYFESDKKKNEEIKSKINVSDLCIKKLVDLLTILTNHVDNTIKQHIDKKNELKNLEKTLKSLKVEKENLENKKEQQDKIISNTEQCFEEEKSKWNKKIQEEERKIVQVEKNVKTIYENIDNINFKTNREIKEIKNLIKHIQDTVNNYNRNCAIITDLIENTRNSQKILSDKIQNNIQKYIKANV